MQSAAELGALYSLLDHYTQQANIHRQSAEATLNLLVPSEYSTWDDLRDNVLQLVKSKLAEVKTPDSEFDWGPIGFIGRTWALRYCLTLLRESRSRIGMWGQSADKPQRMLSLHVRPLLVQVARELAVLSDQDGVFGTPALHTILGLNAAFNRIIDQIPIERNVMLDSEARNQLWVEMQHVHDEQELFSHLSPV